MMYVTIGSVANFVNEEGYVRDIGWLLALSLGLAVLLGFLAAVSLAVYWSWPFPPDWTLGALRTDAVRLQVGPRPSRPKRCRPQSGGSPCDTIAMARSISMSSRP